MKIAVRPFRKTDARAVAAMMRKLAAFHNETSPVKPSDFARYALGQNKTSSIWVAVAEGKPIGYIEARFFMNFVRGFLCAKVETFFVEEKYRRQGIGLSLIQAVLQETQRKGCKRFGIGALPQNKLSNRFYAKLGLNKTKKSSLEYRADATLIKKLLAANKEQTR